MAPKNNGSMTMKPSLSKLPPHSHAGGAGGAAVVDNADAMGARPAQDAVAVPAAAGVGNGNTGAGRLPRPSSNGGNNSAGGADVPASLCVDECSHQSDPARTGANQHPPIAPTTTVAWEMTSRHTPHPSQDGHNVMPSGAILPPQQRPHNKSSID